PLAGVEPRRRAPHFEQSLLRDLFRLGRVPEHLLDQPEDRSTEFVVDRFERRVVTTRHPNQEPRQDLVPPLLGTRAWLGLLPHAGCIHDRYSEWIGGRMGANFLPIRAR